MRPTYVALACFLPGALFAQEAPDQARRPVDALGQARFAALVAQIQDLQRRHSITVHGADDPGAMPLGIVYSTYFARFRMVDDASFAQFALEEVGATGSDVDVLKGIEKAPVVSPAVDLCADVLEGPFADAGGLEIARHIVAAEASGDRNWAAPYQMIVDGLSPRVRANVLRGIDEVARGLSSTELDHLSMATEDPDLYRTMITGYCRGNRRASVGASKASSAASANQIAPARAR
jgi:hypothetical protein